MRSARSSGMLRIRKSGRRNEWGKRADIPSRKILRRKINEYKETRDRLEVLVDVEPVKAPTGSRTYKKRGQHTGFVTVAEAGKVEKKAGPAFCKGGIRC